MKRSILFLLITFSASFTTESFAYKTFTHELITIRSSTKSNNYQKFKSDFKIDGIRQLREGSVKEDESPRYRNHFYDPINNTGLNLYGVPYGGLSKEWGFARTRINPQIHLTKQKMERN